MRLFDNNPRVLVDEQSRRLRLPVSFLVSSITLSFTIINQFSAVVISADISECNLI